MSGPTARQLAAANGKRIRDILSSQLKILFVGINPSLYSAAVGHHFARPGNRFWPSMHRSQITPHLLAPSQDRELLRYGCGLTNLVARATSRADQLTEGELQRGLKSLKAKVRRRDISCVAFLGIGAFRTAWIRPQAQVGAQPERIGTTAIWVLPNPSGLNAHYQLDDFTALFRELNDFVDAI